jgi:hypothetical protein
MVGASSNSVISRTTRLMTYLGISGLTRLCAVCTHVTAPINVETMVTMTNELIPTFMHSSTICLRYVFSGSRLMNRFPKKMKNLPIPFIPAPKLKYSEIYNNVNII